MSLVEPRPKYMFGRYKSHKDNGFSPIRKLFGLFRLALSFFIMAILLLGVYQAYKSFSGIDPLKMNPRAILENFLASDDAYDLINSLLTADPKGSIDKAKEILSDAPANKRKENSSSNSEFAFRFAIVTDSHNDNNNLRKALTQAKNAGAKFIVGLGDYSDVGTVDELRNSKVEFDTAGLSYYVTAGDHDLWDGRDKKQLALENFKSIYGNSYQSFAYNKTRFILIDNSDNYAGLDGVQLQWVEDELKRAKEEVAELIFVGLHIPLYHPSSDHVMGKTEPKLKSQAEHLISLFEKGGVDEIFAGDTHFFSRYSEPKSNLNITSVGAVTSNRNPQAPRFVLVDVYSDGGYNVQDTEINN